MQDIIEGDDVPLQRLFAITLRAALMVVLASLTPQAERSGA
ncbi:MAG: hypothetical protein QM739_08255 [Propionivibrio sp.]